MKSEYPTHLPIPNKKFFKHEKLYKDYPMKQADGAIAIFKSFFASQKFDRIIELGTGAGGFTLFLIEHSGAAVHTFDIKDKINAYRLHDLKLELDNLGVSINIQNIFETDDVRNLIENDGRVLVLCDNGDKPTELEMFSEFLKVDDVIMVHDYLKDEETYYNQNIWKTCGFIEEYISNDSLVPFHQKQFDKAFWLCRIKK